MSQLRTMRLKVAELFEIEGMPPSSDLAAITILVAKQYAFLPQPMLVREFGQPPGIILRQ